MLHRQWLESELTHDELSLLFAIMQQDSQFEFDLDSLQCVKLNILGKKMQQTESKLNECGKEIYQSLKTKLIDFTNLQLQ
jgi:hypothetical protein